MRRESSQDRSGRDDEKKGMNRPGFGRGPRVRLPRAPRIALYLPAMSPKSDICSLWVDFVRRAGITFAFSILVGFGSVLPAQVQPRPLASNRVVRVIDGDTVDLNRGGEIVRCRLIGVDAPESTTRIDPYGPEASAYLRGWLEGKTVRVDYERKDKRGGWERDRYGRLLVYLFADRGRQLVNLALVERGQARFYGDFVTRYRDQFKVAELRARAAGLGLWGANFVGGRHE